MGTVALCLAMLAFALSIISNQSVFGYAIRLPTRPVHRSLKSLCKTSSSSCDADIESETLRWVRRVVIGLNLCPFAEKPFREKKLRVSIAHDRVTQAIETEMRTLIEKDEGTTLVVCPSLYPTDFEAYVNAIQDIEERTIKQHGWDGVLQIAPFHPLFRFEGSEPGDPDNYTNRAPFPIVHILREDDVSKAAESLNGNSAIVWTRNVNLLQSMAAHLTPSEFETIVKAETRDSSLRAKLRLVLSQLPESKRM